MAVGDEESGEDSSDDDFEYIAPVKSAISTSPMSRSLSVQAWKSNSLTTSGLSGLEMEQ